MNVNALRPDSRAEGDIAGVGIGLRSVHIREVLETHPDVPWFEILADNHTAAGGRIAAELTAIRENYPITFHCVGTSLGGLDPLDTEYLRTLKDMSKRYEPALVSDHLCFSSLDGTHYHDLLPLHYTEEAVRHVAGRISQVQDYLGRQILIENVSGYMTYTQSVLSEAEFILAVAETADCGVLLDINNIHVNAFNHGLSAMDYLDTIPPSRVQEIHLGGYENMGMYLLDAHNNAVSEPVWTLYRECTKRFPATPTLIEWDNEIPPFTVLQQEAETAGQLAREQCGG